jgi:hypothetical protein
LLLSAQSAVGDEQAGLNWKDLRPGGKVSSELLCALSLTIFVEEAVNYCKFSRLPFDEATERGIKKMEEFVIANSVQHPQMSTFVEMRRAISESFKKATPGQLNTLCTADFDKWWRSASPSDVDASVEKLLATPFDPDRNIPCGP